MKKIYLTLFILIAGFKLYSQDKSSPITINVNDLKDRELESVLKLVFPNKTLNNWHVKSFAISCDGVDTKTGQSFYYQEQTTCGHLTNGMYSFLQSNANRDYRFTLKDIRINYNGEPGTFYRPELVAEEQLPDFDFKVIH